MGKESFILLVQTKEQRLSQALTPFRAVLELPGKCINVTIHIWMHAATLFSMEHARCTKELHNRTDGDQI